MTTKTKKLCASQPSYRQLWFHRFCAFCSALNLSGHISSLVQDQKWNCGSLAPEIIHRKIITPNTPQIHKILYNITKNTSKMLTMSFISFGNKWIFQQLFIAIIAIWSFSTFSSDGYHGRKNLNLLLQCVVNLLILMAKFFFPFSSFWTSMDLNACVDLPTKCKWI